MFWSCVLLYIPIGVYPVEGINIQQFYLAPRVDFELNFHNAKLHHGEYSESIYSCYLPIELIVAKQMSSNLRKITEIYVLPIDSKYDRLK